jgi:NAD(P)-dependent dehydrogenase (short-subunit alcohol dehydrogenase family)
MDLGLRDKVCVVTGSTGGIGLETARLFREEGATIVTAGRSEQGIGDLHVAADLSKPGEPERLIASSLERFGRIDCLVNNVGWAEIHTWDDLDDEVWERSWQINVMSAVRAVRAALPSMRQAGSGAIVNVSSTAGKRP